jgi:hypothetical protein
MAIAGVGSFSRGLSEGLARQGRVILGGDVSFILIQREASVAEREFAASFGALSVTATMRAMARIPGDDATLVELKTVDGAYPLYGAEPKGGYPLGMVADWTRACQEAVQRSRPVFAVLQYFQFTGKGRWPTCDELRNMSYMAIAEGSTGLFYWSFGNKGLSWVKDLKAKEDYWDRLKRVTGELHELEPVLLSPDSPDVLSEQPPGPLRVLCKEHGGKRYVFASNPTGKEVKAAFRLKAEAKGISVHKEGRDLTPENGGRAFSDGFGPFQAHIYVLQSVR